MKFDLEDSNDLAKQYQVVYNIKIAAGISAFVLKIEVLLLKRLNAKKRWEKVE